MPQIIDVIKITTKYGSEHFYVVVDEAPKNIWRRVDQSNLVLADEGFYKGLRYETPGPNWQAFGGAKFDINLDDGTVLKASGQWWSCMPLVPDGVELISVGVATLAELQKCYVFSGFSMDKSKLDAWLQDNEPSSDYRKYERQRAEGSNSCPA